MLEDIHKRRGLLRLLLRLLIIIYLLLFRDWLLKLKLLLLLQLLQLLLLKKYFLDVSLPLTGLEQIVNKRNRSPDLTCSSPGFMKRLMKLIPERWERWRSKAR